MKTKITTDEDLDAVELQHRIRTELSSKLSTMSHKEEIEFFKKASEGAKKRRAGR
ncbi:MAG: hypothetical protein AAF789_07410 [Bacteroidota bacterium]